MGRKVNFIVLTVLVAISFIYGIVATPGSDWPEVIETHPGDVAWMVVASAFVLLMTPGLAFFYGGMVDRKNVISTMLQSFVAWGSSASYGLLSALASVLATALEALLETL